MCSSRTPSARRTAPPAIPTLLLTVPLLLACALAPPPAAATDAVDPPGFAPVFRPQLATARAGGAIRVDGELDDPGWRNAGRATGFVERSPGENIPPLAETHALITYDDDNLYVAFVCTDDPAAIRATMCQRDMYDNDDAVGFLLDTFGEAAWAYEFFVNPYGIQKDLMWTNIQGEDDGFDMVWDAAARTTETGYVVEMAIPLAGLRFPDREAQSWRVDFWRVHPRDSEHYYSWSARDIDEQCFPCQWGTVEGIEGIRPGKGLEILPSYIAYRTGSIADPQDPDSGIDDNALEGEPSLGAKYAPTSDITLEATVNPDFSQIEADADQIDVNTTIVQRFPERRPFFQEGNDLFRTMFNSFYTRMVSDPELALKGTARWDRSSLAYMLARDEHSPYIVPAEERSYTAAAGRSTVNILRGLHSLGSGSQVGFMFTDRRYDDGGSGTILSADTSIRLATSYSWLFQGIYSHSREPDGIAIAPGATFGDGEHTLDLDGESYAGTAFITELRRNARNWFFILDYNQLTPTYRTQTGYDPWTDQRNSFVYTHYSFYPERGLLELIQPSVQVDARWNTDGLRKWWHARGQLAMRLRWAQTGFGLGYVVGEERWSGVQFDDLWTARAYLNSRPSDVLGLSASLNVGEGPALFTLDRGDEISASLALDIKPVDRLILEPTLDYIRSEHADTGELLFEQTILRARIGLQVDPRLSLRLVVQHNDSDNPLYRDAAVAGDFPDYHMYFGSKWEVDPLLTYRLNSFSVFYLGSTHDYRDFNAAYPDRPSLHRMTDRQYFMKVQYLFQN